jgi:ferredoxin
MCPGNNLNRPVVDLSACNLCMGCVEVCGQVFSLNPSGFISVCEMAVYPSACVDEAIMYCPEDAIAWEADE